MLPDDIISLFRQAQDGTTLLVAVGNSFRSDDGLGPYVAARLPAGREVLAVLDAGERPEDILGKATDCSPTRVIILDAADFGGRPGEVRIIPPEAIPDKTMSTHRFPLKVVARLLEADTGAAVHFLGVQPGSLAFGEGLSPQVKATADDIIAFLRGRGAALE